MERNRTLQFLRQSIMEIVLVALFVTLACTTDHFLSVENLLNILRNISIPGIIALGMTMVIIAGEIDLSVGSMVAFAGCLCAGSCNTCPPPSIHCRRSCR